MGINISGWHLPHDMPLPSMVDGMPGVRTATTHHNCGIVVRGEIRGEFPLAFGTELPTHYDQNAHFRSPIPKPAIQASSVSWRLASASLFDIVAAANGLRPSICASTGRESAARNES